MDKLEIINKIGILAIAYGISKEVSCMNINKSSKMYVNVGITLVQLNLIGNIFYDIKGVIY